MIIQVITEPVAGGAEALVCETHRRYLARGVASEAVFFVRGGAAWNRASLRLKRR
jgi:hypothetical protein